MAFGSAAPTSTEGACGRPRARVKAPLLAEEEKHHRTMTCRDNARKNCGPSGDRQLRKLTWYELRSPSPDKGCVFLAGGPADPIADLACPAARPS